MPGSNALIWGGGWVGEGEGQVVMAAPGGGGAGGSACVLSRGLKIHRQAEGGGATVAHRGGDRRWAMALILSGGPRGCMVSTALD